MKHTHSEPEPSMRMTVLIAESDRRAIVEHAAERSVETGRPISVSQATRELLRAGLEAQAGGGRAA